MFKTKIPLSKTVRSVSFEGMTNSSLREDEIQRAMDPDNPVFREWEEECQARSEASYKFGVEDGRKLGFQEGQESVNPFIQAFENATNDLMAHRVSLGQEMDEMILQLALSVAERVIHREVSLDRTIIKDTIRESLKYIEDHEKIVIRLHPDDWQSVKSFEDEIRSFTHELKVLQIQEDEHVESGGCIIESNVGMMDGQIRTQLEEIMRNLQNVQSEV